jgi:hypothetical protein
MKHLRGGDYFVLVRIVNVVTKLGITDLLLQLDINTVNCFGRLENILHILFWGKIRRLIDICNIISLRSRYPFPYRYF